MVTKATSVLVAVLFLGTILWGQCASCPLVSPDTQNHDCCGKAQSDHCKTPKQKTPGKTCPSLAMAPESYYQVHPDTAQLLAPPLADSVPAVLPEPEVEAVVAAEEVTTPHSPPDLYLLNSTLLV